jgi:phosphate transport system ATP-binding protein
MNTENPSGVRINPATARASQEIRAAVPPQKKSNATNTNHAIFSLNDVSVSYGDFIAVSKVNMEIPSHSITAFIGPSGCGKSTLIRSLNRTNDLIPGAKVGGKIMYEGIDLYASDSDAVEVRRRIGMVFQKPNPFPKSIYDNVAFGPRVNYRQSKSELDGIVESSLKSAALWDEVKNRLKESALGLSGGQQQRLCIARSLAVNPDVILMDEPCSALDPIATMKIEDLMIELAEKYTIVIVTHNMQQASRVASYTAFFSTEVNPDNDRRTGQLVEFDDTRNIFLNPTDPRTEAYVTGRVG